MPKCQYCPQEAEWLSPNNTGRVYCTACVQQYFKNTGHNYTRLAKHENAPMTTKRATHAIVV